MSELLKEESTVTAKGQTTVPMSIRRALGVDYGGRIAFGVNDRRQVSVVEVAEEANDPVVDRFLVFLEQDMLDNRRSSIIGMPESLRGRMDDLVGKINVDFDEEIEGDVEL